MMTFMTFFRIFFGFFNFFLDFFCCVPQNHNVIYRVSEAHRQGFGFGFGLFCSFFQTGTVYTVYTAQYYSTTVLQYYILQ